jgi:putative nucleotidyltransferase with HDIG domain
MIKAIKATCMLDENFRTKLINKVLEAHAKEYACHVQYVAEIGLRLAQETGADPGVIETACLLHDIGRDFEQGEEDHAEAGYRIAKEFLSDSPLTEEQRTAVINSILSHNSDEVPATLPQQIVRSADAGSKVEFHEAFVLMSKKQTYVEKLLWARKYLDKGYSKISFDSYKESLRPKYEALSAMYQRSLTASENDPGTRQI